MKPHIENRETPVAGSQPNPMTFKERQAPEYQSQALRSMPREGVRCKCREKRPLLSKKKQFMRELTQIDPLWPSMASSVLQRTSLV